MKQDVASSKLLRLEDPQAARVVADLQARRFLEPFIGQERTVKDVAAALEVNMSSVLYRVRQFIRLGLLREVRAEPRKGRPIRHYRSVADGFFVPFAATPLATQEALSPHTFGAFQSVLNESVGQAWLAATGEQQALGIHLFRGGDGKLNQDIVPNPDPDEPSHFFRQLLGPDAPAVWDTWGSLRLAYEDAKALQQEIASLLGRYRDKVMETGGDAYGDTYIVRLAMAPQRRRTR